MRPIHHFRARLTTTSLHFCIREFDGAPGNDRMVAHLLNLASTSSDIDLSLTCRSHACNLIIVALCTLIGMPTINDVYHLGVFVSLGGHFVRLIAKVQQYVEWALACVEGQLI